MQIYKDSNMTSLLNTLETQRQQNKKIVFTNGCFDLLHVGHVRYLQEAQRQGQILVVGVNSDASVKRLKGASRPIQSEADRAEILLNLKSVDHVVIFSEDTPESIIKAIRPDVLVKGGDWKIDQIVGAEFVIANGGQVKSLTFIDGKSTTKLIEKSQK